MPRRHLVSLVLVIALIVGFAAVGIVHTMQHGMHHAAPGQEGHHHHGH
jgi:hypothetical protein